MAVVPATGVGSAVSGRPGKGRDEFFSGMLGKVVSILGAPPQLEVHDITASDEHAVGIYTVTAERDGKRYQWPHVNVYHLSGDKITEFWWTPFDQETARQALS